MDHYAPSPELANPVWRTRTLIVSGIAAAELVALIALGVVLLGKSWFTHERTAAAATHATVTHHQKPPAHVVKPKAPAKPMLAPAHTSVLVLNGNGQNGAAGAEARVIRAHGYPIAAVTNAKRNDYAASIVMYRPGYAREAQRLAHNVGAPMVSALDGFAASQLRGARLVFIVGR
jgi:hypothetical protein